MTPRRLPLLLLSALVLVLTPLLVAPTAAQTTPIPIVVNRLTDDPKPSDGSPFCTGAIGVPCSLRQALTRANEIEEGQKNISFASALFSGGTIVVENGLLPALATGNTSLSGPLPGGPGSPPVIAIVGSPLNSSQGAGLQIFSDNNSISNLAIYGFNDSFASPQGGSGIYIQGSNNRVSNTYIGLAPSGVVATSNARGITIAGGSSSNIIGLTAQGGFPNVIAGNEGVGIDILSSSRNQVSGNFIGARPVFGASPPIALLGNGSYGIQISSPNANFPSEENLIGGTNPNETNIIAGNNRAGLRLTGPGARQNQIRGNYIGAYLVGIDLGNDGEGIVIESGANANVLAGTADVPLIVSDNLRTGVLIQGSTTANNRIEGNTLIGVDFTEAGTLGNGFEGVRIADSAPGTQITGRGVQIAGNSLAPTASGANVRVDSAARNTTLNGIYLGAVPGAVGPVAVTPRPVGVLVSGATNTTLNDLIVLGHTTAALELNNATTVTVTANRVLSNPGVALQTEGGSNLVVSDNQLNGNGAGLLVNSTLTNLIEGNLIGGHKGVALRLTNAQTTTISLNTIGLSANQRDTLPNEGTGIALSNARNTLIANNAIAANNGPGINLSGAGTVSTTITTNVLGLRRDAETKAFIMPAGNLGAQINVAPNVSQVRITANQLAGAEALDPENVPIPGQHPAIQLTGPNLQDVTIQTNQIGWVMADLEEPAMLAMPHAAGIVASDVRNLLIDSGNTIRYSSGDALRLTNALSVTVQGNDQASGMPAILANGGAALRLLGNTQQVTVTANQFANHGAGGLLVTGDAQRLRITDNQFTANGGDAISLNATNLITSTLIEGNLLVGNAGWAIKLNGNVQRASFFSNRLANNLGGIVLNDTTFFTPPDTNPGLLTNPNHDLDPPPVDLYGANRPLRLQLSNAGVLAGYVFTNTVTTTVRNEADLLLPSACVTCTIQLFVTGSPDPEIPARSGQGFELLPTTPLGGGSSADRFLVTNANGYFERQLDGPVPLNRELLLIATDGFGNSSEYAIFFATAGLAMGPAVSTGVAPPGGTVTYTLQLTNTGSMVLPDVRIEAPNLPAGWTLGGDPAPGSFIPLADGESRTITVTLRLPLGASVPAGQTVPVTITARSNGSGSVQASVRLDTTILPQPVLTATPEVSTGANTPGGTVGHVYVLRNDGNTPMTIRLSADTPPVPGVVGDWTTTVIPEVITNLAPGEQRSVEVQVRVPNGAPVTNQQGFPTATTTITAAVDAGTGFEAFTRFLTARTRVLQLTDVSLSTNPPIDSVAGARESFIHTVRNLSNSTRQFCLLAPVTSKGSTVQIVSATTGFVIDTQGCFTLYTEAEANPGLGRYNQAQFEVIVVLPRDLRAGETETVTIGLRDGPDGDILGSARATNTIRITRGLALPSLWLPLISR
ncbi:MAG: right-handed parallel beta-helix repeat-containing protein [Oscillochloridaceae bacterium umkhey_bin13]